MRNFQAITTKGQFTLNETLLHNLGIKGGDTTFDIQRLHDINLSGWIVLVKFIPVVGFILPIILIFIPGDKTTNTYGDPPQPD